MQKNSFSPKKYLKEKGKQLPIEKCLISDSYNEQGFTMCLSSQTTGRQILFCQCFG